MLMKVACEGTEELDDESFGEEKSNRMRFQPGSRWIKALKYESLTGQQVAGNRP